jgi:hypothetical protein
VTGPKKPLAEAKRHIRRVVEQLQSIRLQLTGIQVGLPEPLSEGVRHADVSDEMDATTELRTVIACVQEDSIRTAIQDLLDALASLEGKEDEEEREP